MKNFYLYIFSFIFLTTPLTSSLFGQSGTNQVAALQTINCAPALQPYLIKMLKVPEIRTLIASIQQEGPIAIDVNHNALSQQFGAFWDVDHRLICINLTVHQSEGDVIGSLLFELQNAASNKTIESIDQQAKARQINRDQYIQSMEYMEYKNSLNAAALAKKGIEAGLFPQDACLPTYKDFNEHFYYQQISGHSAHFGKNYDHLVQRRA